ncbi:MAG TPA: ABC transporter substrate-binding protein, partial [Stellaceae bacterium]|nr:ABC transporter substrate-binding protein [Stellaceae bacterium]
VAALLAVAPVTAALAQHPANPPAKAAIKPAKPVKAATKKPEAHPQTKLATAKHKAPERKLAAAKKPELKKLAAAKKPEVRKLAAAKQPAKLAEAAMPAAAPAAKATEASYTITSTHGGVTTTATRVVPFGAVAAMSLAAAASPPPAESDKPRIVPVSLMQPAAEHPAAAAKAAVVPVSLTQPAAEHPAAAAKPVELASAEALPAVAETAPAAIATAAPGDKKAAVGFVSKFLTESFRIAKASGANSLQRRAALADLFAHNMDVKRIAGYTTADQLTGASSDIQNRFRTILVSYLVETYYPQLELASDPTVRVETAAATPLKDGTAVVWTTFTKDGWGSQSVQWHLEPEGDGYKIVDIFSAGASLVQMERDTFKSVMRNGGLNELMAKLDQRTKELASAATE